MDLQTLPPISDRRLEQQRLRLSAVVSQLGSPQSLGLNRDIVVVSERDEIHNHAIYQKDSKNFDHKAAIYRLLKSLVPDETKIYVSGNETWTGFFATPVTPQGAQKVKDDPNVGICGHIGPRGSMLMSTGCWSRQRTRARRGDLRPNRLLMTDVSPLDNES